MDTGMYTHPATRENVERLRQRGVHFLGPVEGRMASGMLGIGRMVEPVEILSHARWQLAKGGVLSGKRVLVTAGGTQEPIDPVRVIANRSSGKQGFALAQAALDLGAKVTLVAGPVALDTPVGVERVDVHTAREMLEAVLTHLPGTDILLMAAAVADYRPAQTAENKIKKSSHVPEVRLEATEDVLAEVAVEKNYTGFPRVTVGFAAESQDLLANAQAKLEAKHLDLVVANDISASDAGFGVDTNRVVLLAPGTEPEQLPLMNKHEVAAAVLERVTRLL